MTFKLPLVDQLSYHQDDVDFFFVLAAAIAVPEGAIAGFAAGVRAAFGFAGGGVTAAIGKVSNLVYGNKIMSTKKIECWKKTLSSKLKSLHAGNNEHSAPIQIEINSIFNKISEGKKVSDGELKRLTEEEENLTNWSKDLKQINIRLKEIKRKFEELQPT